MLKGRKCGSSSESPFLGHPFCGQEMGCSLKILQQERPIVGEHHVSGGTASNTVWGRVCAGNAAAFRQGRRASGATCAGLSGCSISCSVIN